MSDPRAYEQLLGAHLQREGADRPDRRIAELEREVAELAAELTRRDAELERSQAEAGALRDDGEQWGQRLETLQARLGAAEERLRSAAAERDAALRELERKATTIEKLEAQARGLGTELEERRGELGDAGRRLDEREGEIANLEAAVAELQQAREAAEARTRRVAEDYRSRVRELEQLASTLAGGLAQTKADIDRAAGSRAWRWGHGATKALRRLTLRRNVTEGALARALKRIEQLEQGGAQLPPALATAEGTAPAAVAAPDERSESERAAARRRLALEIRERLGPAPELEAWPPVSIVVPTRNGREHIERLVAGLSERTDYPQLELIVVDNASEDGTLEFLAGLELPFPLQTIANEEPATFSAANGQGAAAAAHDHVLFLNNDIEPFEPGWLRELVAAHQREGVAAVGATLLRSPSGPDPELRDRTVQHRAVKFRAGADGVRAYNAGDGADLFEAGFGVEERVPAVTAAALLMTRERFEEVGGFGERYRFGTEDVDLGLKLTASGDAVVATGRSVLYHRESVSQDAEGRDFMRNNRLVNRRVFLERWGPQVRRSYRLGRLRRDPFWTDGEGPHVAITVTSLDPAAGWGDWYTAHEIGEALAAIGWRVTYVERRGEAWYDLPGDLDYLLALMDPFDLRRVPPQVTTIVWIRNWTERWLERPWFERADLLLVSSARSREIIEEATGRQTIPFPLAANPERFRPLPADKERASDYVFTGNHWGKDRDIQAGLQPGPGERLAVYGKGWDEVPEIAPHWRGAAPYEELPAIYSSAKLVLDDTSGPTLPYGAVNSRVFDALAAGTLPITNCEAGVRELFGPEFPVWSDAESLRAQIDALLGDEERREALARRFRGEVLSRHTYAHRARRLAAALEEHEEKRSFCIKIGAPNWEEAERWGDLHFARAIQRDLRRRGHPCAIQVLEEWESDEGLVHDVAIVIRGLSRHLPKPGQLNVLWNISHPADLGAEECDGYDLVCVASARFAEELRGRTSTPVVVLEQATDPALFYRDPSPDYEHDLVYVANSRGVLRPIVRDLLPTERDLAIYGANWDGLIDTRYVVAEHVANEELRKVYSSAKVVLCDHWDDMREHGFVSNRIYDALACGASVISDPVPGLEAFEGVLTYETPEQLAELVDEVLGTSERPRGQLPEGNAFSDRVEELLAALPEASHAGSIASKRLASSA
jgi:GT2 family glycosyltransferase/spore maturation protein CgeB/predicted  nucleic acid-binding Zn-ribbon protein